jgi:hypothetical protein
MLVRKISIFFIIIIILIELYIHFCVKLEVDNNNFTNNELEDVKEIIIMDKEPWNKMKETKGGNYYYINILKFDEVKFIEWKNIIPNIEYDITNKLLKIPSRDEERAMSIVNLMISNMKGDIELNEIIESDLINKSIIKSRKFNVVFTKIKNLVIENNKNSSDIEELSNLESLNTEKLSIQKELNDELKQVNEHNVNNNVNNNIHPNNSKEKSIKPEDYNYDGFNNSHYNIFKKGKLIRNKLTSGAYGGKQYARPFR